MTWEMKIEAKHLQDMESTDRRNFGTFEVFANENTNKIAFYLVIVLTSAF